MHSEEVITAGQLVEVEYLGEFFLPFGFLAEQHLPVDVGQRDLRFLGKPFYGEAEFPFRRDIFQGNRRQEVVYHGHRGDSKQNNGQLNDLFHSLHGLSVLVK